MEFVSSAKSSKNWHFVNTSKKILKKKKFFRKAQLNMKSKVCLKYFAHDCSTR